MKEQDEQIKAHLMWIWGQKDGFIKRGMEGMMIITNRRIAFITRTNMTYKVHDAHSLKQLKRFKEGEDVFRPIYGYTIKDLICDLAMSNKNLEIPYDKIVDIIPEAKRWGTMLKVRFRFEGKLETYMFSVVKGWVKYPLKDPVEFQHIDWNPLIKIFKCLNF
ncbi:MAG: hypothetical protein WBP64_14430 [Nitrososphaeraceae archaeon]